MHETWFDTGEYGDLTRQSRLSPAPPQAMKLLGSHSPVDRVAEIAAAAPVQSLLLIHLNPAYDEERLLAMEREAQDIFPGSILAKDGLTISLG